MQIDKILGIFTFAPPIVLVGCWLPRPCSNPRESITEEVAACAAGLQRSEAAR